MSNVREYSRTDPVAISDDTNSSDSEFEISEDDDFEMNDILLEHELDHDCTNYSPTPFFNEDSHEVLQGHYIINLHLQN